MRRPGRRVALLSDGADGHLAGLLRRHPHVTRLETFDSSRPGLHQALTASGPFDVVVDDTAPHAGHAALFRSTFLHARRNGTYLVRHAAITAGRATGDDLPDLLGDLLRRRLHGQPVTGKGKFRRRGTGEDRFAAAIGRLTVRGRHVVAVNRVRAKVKLREEDTNALIDSGVLAGQVLATLPATRLEVRGALRESPSPSAGDLPRCFDVPELSLRVYDRVSLAPRQVAWSGRMILPDSFRHNQREGLVNRQLASFDARHARGPSRQPGHRHLPGAWFYLDDEGRGHYGHATTEQLSRLWAWQQAKADEPGLKALMFRGKRDFHDYEADLYAAAGISADDLVCLDNGTVTVDRLYAATPMFSQPEYVHPDLPQLWGQVSTNLAARAPGREYPRRIFCSRRPRKRDCTNGAEVEALFVAHGFEVILPESYPLAEQARIFREAEVIAGYAGSGMFTTMFSGAPKHVILVRSESYTAMNEVLICAAMGHRLDVAWCVADRPATGRWQREVFHSAYRFDPEREGVWLRQILADL